ncbi:MAG: phosphoglucosamine mutase [Prevotella sp.]|nr:phosphoglucosamine mutase [Prevotella sp.]
MALIKSISGIRGTIGGRAGEGLTPLDIVKFVSAYAMFIRKTTAATSNTIVVGRDARVSGGMVKDIVCGTLLGAGFDVLDIGLATTPTTELAVIMSKAAGGIIITASHNPRHWNALKLLNGAGEFLSDKEGKEVIALAEKEDFAYAEVDRLGHITKDDSFDLKHVEAVVGLPIVNVEAIKARHFRVAADTINSVGAVILPRLFEALGVEYTIINNVPDGNFAHNPEPLEQNLAGIMELVRGGGYDMGIVVDPDVDRLAFIDECGRMIGEEYTLVGAADFVLSKTPGNAVSNLSSSRALRDITLRHGGNYAASAVGEVNVVAKMKEMSAVIGGEGNGGVIYPECHYGRDALVGIALFLSALAERGISVSEFRAALPDYFIAKNKVELRPETDIDKILARVKELYTTERITDIDGVKIDFADSWVHLRKSNTEPIIRVYSEAHTQDEAARLGKQIMDVIGSMTK